ncbi:MAG: hypothetical protein K6B52_01895, partial [Clostridiales bacterium]|nr:hypothetical protein [Clostridiales bacterium]
IMAKKRLKRIFGNEASTHSVINGFHFISIGCTRGCLFDKPQRDFLRKSLCEAAADDPKKPIFVFQHPHIQDTVYGSIAWGDDGLTDILISYPQVIDFSGHSHAPINDPRSIHQRHFTCLGTGSLSYFELDEFDKSEGTVPSDGRECAQMLIVEADACGNVRVYPYDLITMNFFPYTWKIDTPWNPDSFLYTDERYLNAPVPFFEEGSVLTATVGENSVSLTFPQAKSSEKYINSYDIVIKDPGGIIRRKFNLFNKYYLYNMPDVLTAEIKDLPGGSYYAEVYATGFFKTKSKKPLVCEMFMIK